MRLPSADALVWAWAGFVAAVLVGMWYWQIWG